jgi:tRNA nucleotidyltransferase (CCA-adding enzyme)
LAQSIRVATTSCIGVEDLELENTGDNSGDFDKNKGDIRDPGDEREPSGLYRCPSCQRLFPNWKLYQKHRREQEGEGDEVLDDSKFPEINMDVTSPFEPHFTPQQPDIMPLAGYAEASRVSGFENGSLADEYYVAYHHGSPVAYARLVEGKLHDLVTVDEAYRRPLLAKVVKYAEKSPSQLLPAPVPFIYDIQSDQVTVGQAGQRTSDIPGQFTPGGILEGSYEPGGKIVIRTMTTMPYSVRHMVELWYWQHPELEVKNVELQDATGSTTKLAAEDIGAVVGKLLAASPAAFGAAQALREVGGNVFAVGGAVRDAISGKVPKDIDLMVTGIPGNRVQAALQQLPGRVDYTGKDFGVFRYRTKDDEVEVALPRRERSTGPQHRDFDVQADHTMTPEEDLYRRDFTANAMAVDLSNGRLIDPYGGANDLAAGRLRTINDQSLSEDPLRVLRGIVAYGRHGLVPDERTRKQMADNAQSLTLEPAERIKDELDKLFKESDRPGDAIKLAHEIGVLRHVLPEVDRCMGYNQNNPHHELQLGDHLLNVCNRVAEQTKDPDLRMAGLLHDIGKPDSAWVDPETGKNHYYLKRLEDGSTVGQMHEDVGADLARARLTNLRYPNDRIKRVEDLIRNHMWKAFTSERGARKFLNRVGDHADDLMTLRWADQGGKTEYPTDPSLSLDTQRNLLEQVRNSQQPTQQSQLAINGSDLLQAGIPQGPEIGQILRNLTEAVIEDPRLNTRDRLLTMALQNGKL